MRTSYVPEAALLWELDDVRSVCDTAFFSDLISADLTLLVAAAPVVDFEATLDDLDFADTFDSVICEGWGV